MAQIGNSGVGRAVLAGLAMGLIAGCSSEGLPDAILQQIDAEVRSESRSSRSPSDRPVMVPIAVSLPPARPVFRSIDEWTVQEAAEHALGRMGPAAVPALLQKLRYRDPDPKRQADVRKRAAEVLAQLGPAAQDAVPDLIDALRDPSIEVRKSAALALGQVGPAAADAVPDLIDLMLSSDVSASSSENRLPQP